MAGRLIAGGILAVLLDYFAPGEQGANSAAKQTNDSVVQPLVLAVGSVVFAMMLTVDDGGGTILPDGGGSYLTLRVFELSLLALR